jgi:hypothetical protein
VGYGACLQLPSIGMRRRRVTPEELVLVKRLGLQVIHVVVSIVFEWLLVDKLLKASNPAQALLLHFFFNPLLFRPVHVLARFYREFDVNVALNTAFEVLPEIQTSEADAAIRKGRRCVGWQQSRRVYDLRLLGVKIRNC